MSQTLEGMLLSPGEMVEHTPGSALTGGQIVELEAGRRCGIATADIAASAKGTVYVSGRVSVIKKTAATFAAGDIAYWDDTNSYANHTGDWAMGIVLEAAAATTATEVVIQLNQYGDPQNLLLVSSPFVRIEHDDTAEFTLIEAKDNKNGLALLAASALIAEATDGSSEDQMVVTLYEGTTASALCTLTSSDAAADAVNDVVQGSANILGAATGAAAKKVTAGVAVFAKVTQATAGGTPTGIMDVFVLAQRLIPTPA